MEQQEEMVFYALKPKNQVWTAGRSYQHVHDRLSKHV